MKLQLTVVVFVLHAIILLLARKIRIVRVAGAIISSARLRHVLTISRMTARQILIVEVRAASAQMENIVRRTVIVQLDFAASQVIFVQLLNLHAIIT
jgi:hypothetical protein